MQSMLWVAFPFLKTEIELNLKKSSLYNLETAIQLAGERLHDLSRPSKKPLGLRANLVSFLRYLPMFLGILVYFPLAFLMMNRRI
jgi:hypothetical protein